MSSLMGVALFALVGLAVVLGYGIAAPGSQLLGRSLVRGRRTEGAVALTFDDGPGEATPAILDLLGQAGIRATFFLCGENVERFPQYARRIAVEGHAIGNHTYSHPYLLWKTPGRIAYEIDRAQKVIARRTGCLPRWFRPPHGIRWFGLSPILRQQQMELVMWSVNGRDWRLTSGQIVERVLAELRPGSIVLLHDGVAPGKSGNRSPTVEALREIVRASQGKCRFVTIPELASASPGQG